MSDIFKGRTPFAPFRFFEEISAVPRGSGNEQGIARYLQAFAQERGLDVYVDDIFNVLIKKPGSKGFENAAPVMLQGHSDIVCEKNAGTDFDFEKDGLKLVVEGDILRADGTTLGADDGYAVAYMLAVLDDKNAVHPPLECLFTAMEEIGLDGALAFDYSRIKARRMIGMDAGGDGVFMVSSAGGAKVRINLPVEFEPCTLPGLKIMVRGLSGGHSGGQIKNEKGNSNRILGRILHYLAKQVDFCLSAISGGMKDNAIPREAECVIALKSGDIPAAKAIIAKVGDAIKAELLPSDSGLYFVVEDCTVTSALTQGSGKKALAMQNLLPSGVDNMSMEIDGLVNASRNFASVAMGQNEIVYTVSVRSAIESLCDFYIEQTCLLADMLGAATLVDSKYPPYPYNPKSKMRESIMELYKARTGLDATVMAIHGGTECGVFVANLEGLDIATLGPETGDYHTPDEWMNLKSFGENYEFMIAFLEKLAKK